MSANYNLNDDLKEALAMAEALETYLRGTELYGHAGGGFFSSLPSLTVGALLLRLRRLDHLRPSMKDSHAKNLDKTVDFFTATRHEWRVHYEEKIQKEIASRTDAMQTFFKECSQSMVNCAQSYRPELLRRTIIQELLTEMDSLNLDSSELRTKVKAADMKLRAVLRADSFQWDSKLEAIYPIEEFWWLYQKPPQPES